MNAALGLTSVAAGVLLLATGCTLSLGLDDQQPCSSDDDCVYSNGQGTCEDNVCMPPGTASGDTGGSTTDNPTTGPSTSSPSTTEPTSTTTTTTPDTESDTMDTETGDTDTDSDSDTDIPTGCTQNTDCSTDQRCGEDDTCIDLLTAECQAVQYPDEDDFDRNNVVFVGSILPTGGSFENLVQPLENAIQLAVEDFNAETTLQGDRQIAWVSCDSTAGVDAAVAAAQHLVDNVGVPAIIGPAFSESVLAVANDVTVDADVFLVTPTATATSITDIADNNLVWRTIAPDTYQGNGIIDRMVDLRAEEEGTRLERLLVLAKNDAYGTGLLGAVQSELESELPGVEIFATTYENPVAFDSTEELLASYGATIAGAFGELPGTFENREDHYTDVLLLGTSETQSLLYAYLSAWGTLQVPPPAASPGMPRFTFSHGSVPDLQRFINEIGVIPGTEPLEPLKPLITANLEGVSPIVFDPDNFNAFNIRYRIRFNNQDALTSSSLSYDATLATFFAMSAVPGDEAITGSAIATSYNDLMDPGGTAISFSGSTLGFISEARNAMAVEGGTVDLQGVSGELTWDEAGDIRTGLFGWLVLDNDPGADVDPLLTPVSTYLLNEAPAADGTWFPLP
ncbi:MAG: ABC transporter substrate-binding protein [Myxococcota bacterium]